jgi:hypothetical protein
MATRAHLAIAFLLAVPAAAAAGPGDPHVRSVRVSVRVVGDGHDARLELPLVISDTHQTVLSEKLTARGFNVTEVMRDGNRLAVLTYPRLASAKRLTYEFTVSSATSSGTVPPVKVSTGDPAPDDEPWLRPTLHLQSSSPLIREKLIQFATPRLQAGEDDAIRIAWELTATGYVQAEGGSSNVLKATRTGSADARGLDRLLATFLRTSGVPARPVGGLDLARKASPRFAAWVEARTGDRWAPLSVGRGLYGELPWNLVKLFHGDRPMLVHEGLAEVSFRVKVSRPPAEAMSP